MSAPIVLVPEGLSHRKPPPGDDRAITVLVVDDEELIRWSLRQRLEASGYRVLEAADGAAAEARLADDIDLVLLDYRLPDTDGLALMEIIRQRLPATPIIFISAHSTVKHAVQALQNGAYHFVTKPFEVEEVARLVDRALETTRLRREVQALRARTLSSLDSLVGESDAMKDVKAQLAKFATSRASTILITGESGTGKDVAARALHAMSARSDAPFMNITCSALPENLLESELFGHEKGAFTDAHSRKQGLLEKADGGTVFLDEIAEMSPPLQAKLLRFLEDRSFRRVGGTVEIRPDVRVIAATNRNLETAVREGRFREDLFYRLSVLRVHMPPLRERSGDLELLVKYFVDRFNHEFHRAIRGLDAGAWRLLCAHDWPGNVRELRNVVERAVLLCESDTLGDLDFRSMHPGGLGAEGSPHLVLPPGGVDLQEVEKDLVLQALERTSWNQTRAGKLLGLNRDQVRYRIDKFGLRGDEEGEAAD